jgi:hypothetical protein
MKKISLILAVLASILSPIAMASSSNADDCSSSNGCGTYAVVDSSGVVTGAIVCTAAVCGAGGSWNATPPPIMGCKNCSLVLEVPASSTGKNQGAITNPVSETNPITYNSNTQTFSQQGSLGNSGSTVLSSQQQNNSTLSNGTSTTQIASSYTANTNVNISVGSTSATFSAKTLSSDNKPIVNINYGTTKVTLNNVSSSQNQIITTKTHTDPTKQPSVTTSVQNTTQSNFVTKSFSGQMNLNEIINFINFNSIAEMLSENQSKINKLIAMLLK